jgi:hypothetical protein
MITKSPPFHEQAEYIDLTLHREKGLAELRFVRPSGSQISVTVPLDQLSELHEDIRQKYLEAPALHADLNK